MLKPIIKSMHDYLDRLYDVEGLEALASVRALRLRLDAAEAEIIGRLRDRNIPWEAIAEARGFTRQATAARFGARQ